MDKASFDPNDMLVRMINTMAMHNIAYGVMDILNLWEPDAKTYCSFLGGAPLEQREALCGRVLNPNISLDPMVFLRLALIYDIHHLLKKIAPDLVQLDWGSRPHAAFQGQAPFDVMTLPNIQGLLFARNYLLTRSKRLVPEFCEEDHEPRL